MNAKVGRRARSVPRILVIALLTAVAAVQPTAAMAGPSGSAPRSLPPATTIGGLAAPHQLAVGTPTRYRVLVGDTIRSISRKTHHDWRDLASWNNLIQPYTLRTGRVLRLTSPDGLTGFKYQVTRVTAAQLGASYRAGCPVSPAHLRQLTVYYVGFDRHTRTGTIIVRDTAAPAVVRALNRLYNARFRINRMEPVTVFGADDNRSMAANNTSAFNCRPVAGTSTFSQHSYGTAVDLNPVQNPWVDGSSVEPPAGRRYLDRTVYRSGMVLGDGAAERAFGSEGWSWGGRWTAPVDYQHFSANGR
ncbi:LysM peptidoglycan-binding domain-containing protein [Nakamurella silvestris]|nr:LysM peptidoglycan-binding domain-containing protein [Nakamurella silvestris]